MVECTPLIVRGTVRPGMCRKIPNSNPPAFEVTLDVKQVIKGAQHEQVTFTTPAIEGLTNGDKSWIDLLAFLRPLVDSTKANAGSTAMSGWVGAGDEIFVLDDKTRPVIQMDGTSVADGESLLRGTLQAAKFAAERGTLLEHPVSIYLWESSTSLSAPRDGRLQALSHRWLADQNEQKRLNGLTAIRYFDSPQNADLLRRLLANDPIYHINPAEEWSPRLEERWWKEYPVREQALNVLSSWKQSRSVDAEIRTPFLRYSLVTWWPIILASALIGVAAILRWKRKGLGASATITLIGLALIVSFAWCRSGVWVESYSYAAAGADFELVSRKGHLALLRIQDDAPPHPWAVRRYAPGEATDRLWFTQYLDPREELGRQGLAWSQGVTKGNSFSYTLAEFPYWLLIAILLAWPASRGIAQLGRTLRRQRRIKQNRCAECGYDLRSSPGRCPECGAVGPIPASSVRAINGQ